MLIQKQRGAAMGFFNWGIFLGYSMSFVLILAEKEYGWRSVYYIAGSPGLLVAVVILVTVREPKRATEGAMVSVENRLVSYS
jgi:MFS family permease